MSIPPAPSKFAVNWNHRENQIRQHSCYKPILNRCDSRLQTSHPEPVLEQARDKVIEHGVRMDLCPDSPYGLTFSLDIVGLSSIIGSFEETFEHCVWNGKESQGSLIELWYGDPTQIPYKVPATGFASQNLGFIWGAVRLALAEIGIQGNPRILWGFNVEPVFHPGQERDCFLNIHIHYRDIENARDLFVSAFDTMFAPDESYGIVVGSLPTLIDRNLKAISFV